jgi:UrcA family protein
MHKFLSPVLLALACACAPLTIAPIDETVQGDYVIARVAVKTGDLVMPNDAPILYERLKLAAQRACHQDHSLIEYMSGPLRRDERRCRQDALDEAVASLNDASVLALHMEAQGPTAYAAR